MATVHYRGAVVPVKREGEHMHKGRMMEKVKTTKALPHRPKGSIDWRQPDKVYGGAAKSKRGGMQRKS
jgi:hypothetical protein